MHRVGWGKPGCHSRYLSPGYFEECKPGANIPRSDMISIGMDAIIQGAEVFYRTGYAYRVSAIPKDPEGLVQLTGFRDMHANYNETFVVDPATGVIRSADRDSPTGKLSYEFSATENSAISDWSLMPIGAYIARFNPFHPSALPTGWIGAAGFGMILGALLAIYARVVSPDRVDDYKRKLLGGLWISFVGVIASCVGVYLLPFKSEGDIVLGYLLYFCGASATGVLGLSAGGLLALSLRQKPPKYAP